jgi:hypothetical protein
MAFAFPTYAVGADPELAFFGAVAGALIGAFGPRRLRIAFEGAVIGGFAGYISLVVVVHAVTGVGPNPGLVAALIGGGFVVGTVVGALYPFRGRGASDQARDLMAAQNDLLQARSAPASDDATWRVTYLVSGFRTRAGLEGPGAAEADWDDDYEYDEIETARESARTWLRAQGPNAVAHVLRLVEGSDAVVVEELTPSGTKVIEPEA